MVDFEFASSVEDKLNLVDQKMMSRSSGYHPDLTAALDHLMQSGGKRIRPIITLLMGSMLGAEDEKLISLSASIELLHTATLVHDDLIDGALLRRGNPTLNSHWTPAATVLTGDFIFAQAALLAAEIGSTEAMSLFAETLSIIVNGELSQLFGRNKFPSRDDYYHRIYEKTGSLFSLSAKAAALISPAEQKFTDPAEKYGREIGKAFQLVDDVLDFTGDQTRIGKPIGNDLRQGVPTLPALYYGEKNPQDQILNNVLDGSATDSEIDQLIERINQSGVIQAVMNEARECTEEAINALKGFPDGSDKKALEDLATYIVDRDL
ncbi:MAG: polyprenyl synthetase family protein [Anaerolineales bacterium]|nr:polyprenyl synthetase family protein [Anaerolineales bacterium]